MKTSPTLSSATKILHDTFKLQHFRAGQERVILTLLEGRSSLAVFPTGGGKSLCYQLPALLFEHLTIVVSPLIALMKDQVDALQALGISAARLDSSQNKDETYAIYSAIQNKQLTLLYVSPERLKNQRFLNRLKQAHISLLAVDEAHCMSQWGHNFRPDYLNLAGLAQTLNVKRILALTATATPSVAADICRQFSINKSDHIQTSFSRKNLEISITPYPQNKRIAYLVEELQKQSDTASTIIYVTLQQTAIDVAQSLNKSGLKAHYYHAGLKDEERVAIQNTFMKGDVPIVVATIAFGMGIDKSNIRAVYHFNLPKSIENYVQEIGRAGRDGETAKCHLLANNDDIRVLENFTYGDTPSYDSLKQLISHIVSFDDIFDISTYELSKTYDLRPLVLNTALTYLELNNVIQALGPFYAEHKIHFLHSQASILAMFDSHRAEFLHRIFTSGHMGRKWLTLDIPSISTQLGETKERINKALDYLADKRLIEVQVSKLRQGYKNTGQITHHEQEIELTQRINALFELREKRDIERLKTMVEYMNKPQCFSQQLIAYFGEPSGTCGTCSYCMGKHHTPVQTANEHDITDEQLALINQIHSEAHHGLAHPRQLARFLCGLPSPATRSPTLKKHKSFGALCDIGFLQVLHLLE